MRILLICKGEYRYFFPGIATALREKYRAQVNAVAFSSPTACMLEKTGVFDRVFNLAAWLRGNKKRHPADCLAMLRNLEALPTAPRISTMVHADRILRAYPEAEVNAILASICRFWQNIWHDEPPDAAIGEVACATEWIAWLTAWSQGISYFIPCPTPVAKRFFFLDAPDGIWRHMASSFRQSKKRELSSSEISMAETFIQSVRAKKTKPPFLQWAQRSPLMPEAGRVAQRVRRIPFRIRTYVADGKFEVGSYHGTPPWKPIWEDAVRVIRHAAAEAAIFKHRLDVQGTSVYFPLHVQPEFTTDVRAPFFTNQTALVENISKSVPVGYRVLVKEHPGMKGERALGYYRDLKKHHNVQLFSPSVDSHDLIQASDAVLTITGSSAWEAILYEKPIIAFGPLCYGFYDLIYQCENVADLPGILSDAIHNFTPNHGLLLKLVWSLFESAYELEWGDPVRQPRVTEADNCEKVADAIFAELGPRSAAESAKVMLA